MKLLTVEQGVVIPQKGFRLRKYPWKSLRPANGTPLRGDSFLVECADNEVSQLWNSLTSCANSVSYKTGYKFTMRRVLGGIRVWRLI